MKTYKNTSLNDTYTQVAQYFLYKGQCSFLLNPEYLRLSRIFAKRAENIGSQFDADNGCVRKQETYEYLSNDLEALFYTLNSIDSANPLLMDIHHLAERMDQLAIDAYVRDNDTSENGPK